MKFSVAVPLVALLTASILALLALLAGIRPHFMPDAYIVRIAERNPITPDEPTPTSTVPRVPLKNSSMNQPTKFFCSFLAKGGNTALPTITSVPPAQSTESKGKKIKGETTEKTKTKTRTKKITVTTETTKTKTKTKKIKVTTETTKTKTNKPKSTSDASPFKHEVLPIISATATATASTRTASPTYGSVETDKSSKQENWHIFESGGRRRVESMDNAQVAFPVRKRVPGAEVNDHFLIHGRSDPGNHTSNETATDLLPDTYSMHFLTNCQWNVKNKAENCSKPWDFGSNFFGSEVMEGKPPQNNSLEERHLPQSSPFLFKRKATDPNGSEQEVWKKMKKNRAGFSKVHLTGCVLVGLSFLCTAISFFILPALGKWISVGNLFLATLATTCLLTSSIFTAVLAKELRDRHKKSGLTEDYAFESGNKLKALV